MPDNIRIRRRHRDAAHSPFPSPPQCTASATGESSPDDALAWTERVALSIQYRPVEDLKPATRNPRTHSKKQLQMIAASINEFGFVNPILIDSDNTVVAGHGRLEAAKLLDIKKVPSIRLEHLTAAQKRAYVIADNRLAELAGWDRDLLRIELGELMALEVSFEIELTGFETAEIDLLFDPAGSAPKLDPADQIEEPCGAAVTRIGDLWLLGEHHILCADARQSESYARLLGGEKAQMVFTDPPYNVPIGGHVCGLGRIQHREFAMASGEMSEAEFTLFLEEVLRNLAHASADGSIHYICMDWRHLAELITAGRRAYTAFKNLCVWNKDNGGMGSFYRSKHELVFVFKNGTAPHINNFGLGEKGRYRTNVWDYSGISSLKPSRAAELAMHPTVKPVALVMDAIKDCSKRKGIILDAFGGSGTTLIAAHKTGRRGYLLELDPVYVDVAIRRWQKLSGAAARHAELGLTFEQVASSRLREAAEPEEVRHG
jgi:DNA modification methylase